MKIYILIAITSISLFLFKIYMIFPNVKFFHKSFCLNRKTNETPIEIAAKNCHLEIVN